MLIGYEVLSGKVEAVLIGSQVQDGKPEALRTTRVPKVQAVVGHGLKGDNHAGERLLDVRESVMLDFGLPKGIRIANMREVAMISCEESAEIARRMSIQPIPYGLLGENLVISGIPNLTRLPPGTLLCFRKSKEVKRTAVIAVWGENEPCVNPGKLIEQHLGVANLAGSFKTHAEGRRGLVGWVYSSGFIHEGDLVTAYVPVQTVYRVDAQ